MYFLIKILIIITAILFIPIPISIRLIYTNKFQIYLYNFKLNIKTIEHIIKKKNKKISSKEEIKADERQFKLEDIKLLISNIGHIRFKPKLSLSLKSHYGLEDAAATGILYGIISGLLSTAYELLKTFFNIKKYDLSIQPEYNKLTFNCDLRCIIFMNLAKIIYITIIILKSVKKSKKLNYSFN